MRDFSFSVAHIRCVLVFAWLRAISESSNFGESGARSNIIWALWDWRRVLMDTRSGSTLLDAYDEDLS